jgi:hypothetical protein
MAALPVVRFGKGQALVDKWSMRSLLTLGPLLFDMLKNRLNLSGSMQVNMCDDPQRNHPVRLRRKNLDKVRTLSCVKLWVKPHSHPRNDGLLCCALVLSDKRLACLRDVAVEPGFLSMMHA